MPNELPTPRSLPEAVQEVIRQNVALGYRPARFIQATQEGYEPNLLQVCTDLIYSADALQALEDALSSYPELLTLEDLLARSRYGTEWGFDETVIEQAEARIQYFDARVGYQRWSQQDMN